MAEFEVGHHTYRTDQKLHVFKQAAIVKRIAPLFAGIAGSMSGSPQDVAADVGASVFANMGPIADALAEMKDEDSDFIMKTCLQTVSRKQNAKTWARVMTAGGEFMFEDMGLAEVMQIVWKVLEESLSGFFQDLGTPLSEGEAPT